MNVDSHRTVPSPRGPGRALLAIALALGLIGVPLVAALHHHDESVTGHSCVVCTASHASLIQTQPAPAATETVRLPGRVSLHVARTPARFVPAIHRTRAPPLA